MSKARKDNSFIKKPIYKGGTPALKVFISKHLKYPQDALANKIEGSVKVKFEIDRYGKVGKTKIIASLGYGCDEEAIRLVSLLEFKVPKNPRRLKVLFHKNLTIHFNLPQTPTKKPASIRYTITKDKASNSGTNSFEYTIST